MSVVHLESNEQPRAFSEGRVDGAVTFDPFRAQFLKAGANVLFDSTQIPGEIVDLVAVRASMLERKPKAMQALLKGWFEAIAYLKREPPTPRAAWAFASKRAASSSHAALERIAHPDAGGEPSPDRRWVSAARDDRGRSLMALMVDAKLLRDEACPIEKSARTRADPTRWSS